MAGDKVVFLQFLQGRGFLMTPVLGIGAARGELAAGGGIDGAWDLPFQADALFLFAPMHIGDGGEEGLGVQPPNTSWGALSSAAQSSLLYYPYMMFFPALLIALTMLSFTLMGDGLRDALDPKLRR